METACWRHWKTEIQETLSFRDVMQKTQGFAFIFVLQVNDGADLGRGGGNRTELDSILCPADGETD